MNTDQMIRAGLVVVCLMLLGIATAHLFSDLVEFVLQEDLKKQFVNEPLSHH